MLFFFSDKWSIVIFCPFLNPVFTIPVILACVSKLKDKDELYVSLSDTFSVPPKMTMENSTAEISDFYLRIIDDSVYWTSLAAVGFILSAVITVANFIVLTTIYRDPKKTLRTLPCLLIANLSFSDFMVGLFVVLPVATRDVYRSLHLEIPVPREMLIAGYCLLGSTLFNSSATIVAMSVTCYFAISSPIKYKIKITKKKIYLLIAAIWVASITISFLPAIDITETTYFLVYIHTHISLPALLLVVVYFKGYRALVRRTRELQANRQASTRALERERNMAVTITIILALFVLTYIPEFITIHLAFFCDSCEIKEDSITFHKIDVVLSRFVFLNSALNPFIYAWRMPTYRLALKACCKLVKNNRVNSAAGLCYHCGQQAPVITVATVNAAANQS